jgi:hypothetical protein
MLKTTSALVAIMLSLGLLAAIAPTADAGYVKRNTIGNNFVGPSTLFPIACPLGYDTDALANVCIFRCTTGSPTCYSLTDNPCQPVIGYICIPADLQPGPYGCRAPIITPDPYGFCTTTLVEASCSYYTNCWCWTGPDETQGYLNIYICSDLFDQD